MRERASAALKPILNDEILGNSFGNYSDNSDRKTAVQPAPNAYILT
jgi:hypothetical protein